MPELSDLASITGAELAVGDLLYVVDISAGTTGSRKITYAEFLGTNLTALFGLTGAANKVPYFTGAGAMAVTTLSAYGLTLIDDADAATARTTLGLSLPIPLASGGTNATTAALALTSLGAAINTLTLTAGAGLSGGGNLTANRTFTLNLASINIWTAPQTFKSNGSDRPLIVADTVGDPMFSIDINGTICAAAATNDDVAGMSVVGRIAIRNAAGAILGYLPIYNIIP